MADHLIVIGKKILQPKRYSLPHHSLLQAPTLLLIVRSQLTDPLGLNFTEENKHA